VGGAHVAVIADDEDAPAVVVDGDSGHRVDRGARLHGQDRARRDACHAPESVIGGVDLARRFIDDEAVRVLSDGDHPRKVPVGQLERLHKGLPRRVEQIEGLVYTEPPRPPVGREVCPPPRDGVVVGGQLLVLEHRDLRFDGAAPKAADVDAFAERVDDHELRLAEVWCHRLVMLDGVAGIHELEDRECPDPGRAHHAVVAGHVHTSVALVHGNAVGAQADRDLLDDELISQEGIRIDHVHGLRHRHGHKDPVSHGVNRDVDRRSPELDLVYFDTGGEIDDWEAVAVLVIVVHIGALAA
jgi:hypothetical protein